VKVEPIIKSIIEKRKKLGWSTKDLAEKSKVPHSAIVRMEKGIGYWEDYIKLINSIVNNATNKLDIDNYLQQLTVIKKKHKIENKDIVIAPLTSANGFENRKPRQKKCEWAIKYNQCIKCGRSDVRHIARGLCKNCYDKDIEKRHKNNDRTQKYGDSSILLNTEYLIEHYIEQEKSLADIAKATNCSRQYVHKKLKACGIPLRNKSAARDLALTREKLKFERSAGDDTNNIVTLKKVKVNEDFFKLWSPQMAYVLGIIYTDGNLNPGRIKEPWRAKSTSTVPIITVAQKEPELLVKILHLMDCDAKLYFHKERVYGNTKAGELYHFQIPNEKLYDDIVKLGLTPNKSLTMQFPNIPNAYTRHFIRGCWDGDGSVYIEKRIKKVWASFVSGSLQFVEEMVKNLVAAGFPERTIHSNKQANKSYYFKFSGSQVPMLYHYLYDNVPETECLERKLKLFRMSLK
jgi:predicted DNA-binding protein YlxM (UPF0122 family)/transcriptional regulator with XRE-family HTH domain